MRITPVPITEHKREDAPVDIRGRKRINQLIESTFGSEYKLPANIRTDSFDWRFVTREGKIAKRIRRYLKDAGLTNADLKSNEGALSIIGQLARDHADIEESFIYDIVDRFDWRRGDFGDDGSCYWTFKAYAMTMLKIGGGMAIRFYEDNDFGHREGVGRAWILPALDGYVIFNTYGSHKLVKIARVIAAIYDCDYQKVEIENQGSTQGTLWLNHDDDEPSYGYYLFPHEVAHRAEHVSLIDFEIDDDHVECYSCDTQISEDSASRYGGDYYCEDCYFDHFTYCEHCEEDIHRDDTYAVDGESWCYHCYTHDAFCCDECDEVFPDDYMSDSADATLCQACYEAMTEECEYCGDTYHRDDMAQHELDEHKQELERTLTCLVQNL